jgi:hypothetical protein
VCFVAVEDSAGLMAADLHGYSFRYSCTHHLADRSATEVLALGTANVRFPVSQDVMCP